MNSPNGERPDPVEEFNKFRTNFESAVLTIEKAKRVRAVAVSLTEIEYNALLQALTLFMMPPTEPPKE